MSITLPQRTIGPNSPVFIIAEAGVNHNGNLDMAYQLVDVAVEADADAVKFQTFKAEQVVSPQARKAAYQQQATSASESQLDMIKRLELPFEDFVKLQMYCQERGILFLSTPFDYESTNFLAELDIPIFKIPSGELTNLPFLAYIANKGKPIILSTGMAYLSEVDEAVQTIYQANNQQLVLLHCLSNYPADPKDVNLKAMQTMQTVFQVPVGYSDHTLGLEVSLAATALGACVIEKHFTLDCNLSGPDHQASLEPTELTQLVKSIRVVEQSLGNGRKVPASSEIDMIHIARRSLVAACDISANTLLTEAMIAVHRPGTGLAPTMQPYLIGRKVQQDISAGTVFTLGMLG